MARLESNRVGIHLTHLVHLRWLLWIKLMIVDKSVSILRSLILIGLLLNVCTAKRRLLVGIFSHPLLLILALHRFAKLVLGIRMVMGLVVIGTIITFLLLVHKTGPGIREDALNRVETWVAKNFGSLRGFDQITHVLLLVEASKGLRIDFLSLWLSSLNT